MARYFLEVSYDGIYFHGSQVQGDLDTIQLHINKALNVLLKENIDSFGASRTDEGVHAKSNFYHFDTGTELKHQFLYKLNAILPSQIAVIHIYLAEGSLNARFDALKRQYRYIIYNHKNPFLLQKACFYPFNINRSILHQTAAIVLQYNQFEAFSKRNTQSKTFICNIFQSYWEEKDGTLQYVVEANRFLRGMVRALVGTQLNAARGKYSVDGFRQIIESKDCTLADFSVPGYGLYLEKIEYPKGALQLMHL